LRSEPRRVTEQARDTIEQIGSLHPIGNPVIERQAEMDGRADGERRAGDHHGPGSNATYSEDCALRWIENWRENVHAMCAQIGYRDGSACEVVW
jgi:hypothetical protein